MRVLHVIPSLAATMGGTAAITVQICHALTSLSVESEIYTTNIASPVDAKRLKTGASYDLLPPHADELSIRFFPISHPRRWCFSPALAAALHANMQQFDVVHIHSLNLHPQFAASRACRAANVPYIVSPHGALEPFLRSRNRGRKLVMDTLWQRKMLNSATVIHSTSTREADLVRSADIRAPIATVPFGLDLTNFLDAGRRRPMQQASKPGIVILNHGRLHAKKGLDVMVKAMPAVLARFPDARLELIGPDDTGYGAELGRLADRLGVTTSVNLVGPLSGQILAERVAAADIWALPSKGENFGLAVAEGMAAGVPVIATKNVDFAKAAEGVGGALITGEGSADFSSSVLRVLLDPELSASLRIRGSEFAMRYDLSRVAPEMRDFYERVAAGGFTYR